MVLSYYYRGRRFMSRQIRPTLTIFVILMLLTGVLYPLAITGIAQVVFPFQANGSMVGDNTSRAGSLLIGQDYSSPRYFWGRPSMTPGSPYTAFNALALTGSSGSNLGPLSQALVDSVHQRVDALRAADPGNLLPIPVDLVTASASGLDPNISVPAAYYQAARVARARDMNEDDVRSLVNQYTEGYKFGFPGELYVNVLLLNLALDAIK
jgi:potassium-transporting ATPase KdpC subunit